MTLFLAFLEVNDTFGDVEPSGERAQVHVQTFTFSNTGLNPPISLALSLLSLALSPSLLLFSIARAY